MLKTLSLLNEKMTYCDINFLESVWVGVSNATETWIFFSVQ